MVAKQTVQRRFVETVTRGPSTPQARVAALAQVAKDGAAYQEAVTARTAALAQLRGSIVAADRLMVEHRVIVVASTLSTPTVYDMFGQAG